MRFLAAVLACALALPANAWNFTGHRIVAAIAYDRLTPAARAKVDALIQAHPDYAARFIAGAPADPAARARAAFLYASTWPDVIRADMRFYDETREQPPTPLLPGFQSMSRHVTWHYFDTPYAPDGAALLRQSPPHALSELRRMLDSIAAESQPEAAYDLPWLIHITGDVHNPLHSVSRFLKSQPKGDAGGNFVFVQTSPSQPVMNLHALWDNAAGTDASDAYVDQYAKDAAAAYPPPPDLSTNPNRWLKESFRLARSGVYTFGLETGTKDHPVALPSDYEKNARELARRRVALAGYRLAAVLNDRFK